MEKIKEFLAIKVNNGSGDGDGDGSGDGSGDGDGSGYGDGYGSGDGYGYGSGYGSGDGDGSGDGYGDGYGSGYGYGSGDGSGSGDGDGDGSGDGYGLKTFNGQNLYLIDGVQTRIDSVKGNIAKGAIINSDLTLIPCYIAKGENLFAHGSTLKEAVDSLQKKLLKNLPIEKRVEMFKEKFNSAKKKYKAKDFYEWHFFLTGSCEMGRKSFCSDKGINLDKDKFTVKEFIELTKNRYGSEVIKLLESKLND